MSFLDKISIKSLFRYELPNRLEAVEVRAIGYCGRVAWDRD